MRALKIYGKLSSDLGRGEVDENYYRVLYKYAGLLMELDVDRARFFFKSMARRGFGKWDEGRWGYQEKMDALHKLLKRG